MEHLWEMTQIVFYHLNSMIFDFYFILQLYDTEITFNMQFVSIDNYLFTVKVEIFAVH